MTREFGQGFKVRINEFMQKFVSVNISFVPQSIRDLDYNSKKIIMDNIANRIVTDKTQLLSTEDINLTINLEQIKEFTSDLMEDKFFFGKLHIEVDKMTLSKFRGSN